MAGTLLHVTLAEEVLERAPIEEHRKRLVRAHEDDFRLGSILVDLPYFEGLLRTGARLALGGDMRFGTWGTLLHLRSPAGLLLELLDRADTPARSALALGAITHFAVDVVFHSEIHRRVMAAADGARALETLHKKIEDQMDLHVSFDRLGHSGLGTAHCRRSLVLHPSPGWEGFVREAIAAIHGASPKEDRIRGWRRELALYGLACSSPHVPWVKTLPDDDPKLADVSLRLADEAASLAASYVKAGSDYLAKKLPRAELKATIRDRNLLDGGDPEPRRA